MNKRYVSIGAGVLGAAMLAGCGTDPVKPGQQLNLQPGNGLSVVVFDTLDSLNSIKIISPDHKDQELSIGFVDKGLHLMVFEVPAGTYCLSQFHTGFYRFIQTDQTHGVCWDVVAGKVAYSGNLAPRAYGQEVVTDQNYNWAAFEQMFKDQYPNLSAYQIVTP